MEIEQEFLDEIDRVLREVRGERVHQVEDHGWTPEKDDRRPTHYWGWLLAQRAVQLSCPIEEAMPDARRALIELAGIAVAAIESIDRKVAEPGSTRLE